MTEALKLIVDGYLSLKNREALDEMRARTGSRSESSLRSERQAASMLALQWKHRTKICASSKPLLIGIKSARGKIHSAFFAWMAFPEQGVVLTSR